MAVGSLSTATARKFSYLPRILKKLDTASNAHAGNARALRILVVDDNRDLAESMGKMLEILGHEVRIEFDGRAALEVTRHFIPDVVLLDIGMPGMSGYDVCQRLKQNAQLRKTVVIAQTGWTETQHGTRSHDAGFDHHLVKPVQLDKLQDLLSAIARQL